MRYFSIAKQFDEKFFEKEAQDFRYLNLYSNVFRIMM